MENEIYFADVSRTIDWNCPANSYLLNTVHFYRKGNILFVVYLRT